VTKIPFSRSWEAISNRMHPQSQASSIASKDQLKNF